MEQKEVAKDLIEHYLPSDVLAKIDTRSLEIEKESYVDDELAEHFSDIVYKVKLAGRTSYLCFIFEHKSYRYSEITLQLLRYMNNIWLLKKKQEVDKLPLILPLLIYHGKHEWDIGLKLSDIVEEVPRELETYLPDFKYMLIDLSGYNKGEIKRVCQMKVFIEVLGAMYKDDFEERILEAFEVLDKLERENKAIGYFKIIVKYIMETDAVDADFEDVKRISEKVSKEKEGEIMSIAEELKKEGRQEGRQEGKQEGMLELVEKQLLKKFKSVPQEYREKLKKQDKAKLEIIATEILEMEDIEELKEYLD